MDANFKFLKSVVGALARFNITGEVANFIACQFALESNFGRSNLAIEFDNYCGMKLPVVRRSTALNFGSSDKWSIYSHLGDCVTDYVLCLMYHKPLSSSVFNSVSEFKKFIKGWYCPEKSYLDKIDSIYVQFKNYKNGN